MKTILQEINKREHIVRTFVFKERWHFVREIKDSEPDAITDKIELQRYIQNNVKKGNYKGLKERMIQLEGALSKRYSHSVDPVVYIMHLYFKEELSIRDISSRLALFWVNIPRNTLTNMLTNIFSWTLRPHNEITKVTEKKNRAKVIPNNTKRTAAIQEAISLIIDAALKWKNGFDYNEFLSCRNLMERTIFVFRIFSLAEDKNETKEYLKHLRNRWLSMDTVAIVITKLFENAFGSIPNAKLPKVRWLDVSRLLK
ncbi:MAG: hypothetical protein ACD_2C00069G0006 [uncultured bacterium (gcode 4)]|uniref:Uncharacterized protein n=1 Tax=uncultured bacterium (gcode 4) TaxID=1234023 RepID=K2G6L3_9BACT|nr:MAG: hypothetical protein ACD_2C00069G0006 [uncultured bacterium (gcode 4)]